MLIAMFCLGTIEMHELVLLIPAVGQLSYLTMLDDILLCSGWKLKKTIILRSWDVEKFAMVGGLLQYDGCKCNFLK